MQAAARCFLLVTSGCALALAACERERSGAREAPSFGASARTRLIELQPGVQQPAREIANPYEGDKRALADGRRLYDWFNCSGCHFRGGGGIGPPLMDDDWIYGASPANVFASIVEGRPNGMPAYGGHIPDDQVWKIVAYVRSLSGIGTQLPAGARGDALQEAPGAHVEEAPNQEQDSLKESG